ncbi:CHAT domain-containing protein [Amycolatopsis sp. NPDC051061]|uniref:CHAT domain-containing protein n=1 Tax=Amycolatopsis sp. NPDC051061 TaxID=3155042 RepID=UPI003433A513
MPDTNRLLFRMIKDDDGFLITAALVDERGVEIGQQWWERSLSRAELPVLPDLGNADQAAITHLGLELRSLLTGGGLRPAWAQGVERVVLDIAADELAEIPWEFLVNQQDKTPFTRRRGAAVRARVPYRHVLDEVDVPINVLVIVGDDDPTGVDAQGEIEAIYRGLRGAPCCWHVETIVKPSERQLRDRFEDVRPQVLHFMGHGHTTPDGAALRVMAESGEWDLNARFVSRALGDNADLRLVVLNACRTAAVTPAIRGLVEGFLAEASAVVSTQGDVTSPAAIVFAERMYRELAHGRAVDVAVAAARDDVQFAPELPESAWGLPVLHLADAPETILRHTKKWQLDEVVVRFDELAEVASLVDRTAIRRDVHRRDSGLILVTGANKVGKSLVLRSYLLTKVVGGGSAVYVSLRANTSTEDFIREVVNQAGRWLDQWATGPCTETLDALSGAVTGPVTLGFRPEDAFQDVYPDYKILQALLRKLTERGPLVLVLDNLRQVENLEPLFKGLLRPAALRQLGGVRIVAAIDPSDLHGLVAEEALNPRAIRVRPFRTKDAEMLARELVARIMPERIDDDVRDRWQQVRTGMLEWAGLLAAQEGEFLPVELQLRRDTLLQEAGLK